MSNKNSGALMLRAYNTMKSQAWTRFGCRWTQDDALTQNGNGALKCAPKTVTSPTGSDEFSSAAQGQERFNQRELPAATKCIRTQQDGRSDCFLHFIFRGMERTTIRINQKLLSSYETNRRGLLHGYNVL